MRELDETVRIRLGRAEFSVHGAPRPAYPVRAGRGRLDADGRLDPAAADHDTNPSPRSRARRRRLREQRFVLTGTWPVAVMDHDFNDGQPTS